MFENNNEVRIDLLLQKALKGSPDAGEVKPYEGSQVFYYRVSPLCIYCQQPIADTERETSVRDAQGNDASCHKECALEVMKGVWHLLEQEGAGNTEPFPGQQRADDDTSQITPYVVADLDKIAPMAEPGTVRKEQPQQVHNS